MCRCTPAAVWAAVLHRAFGDLFPVSGTFQLGLTLHSGPSLRHVQLTTHGLILTHGLMASKTKNSHLRRLCPLFPPWDIPPEAMKKSRTAAALFSSPDSQADASVHGWLEMAGYRQLGLKFQFLPELSFLCTISYKQHVGFSFAI